MIQSLKAVNLNGRMTFDLKFHDDINIITGKNGSGKTTVLKLLWYAISGNLDRIVPEITFDSFEVVTDRFSIGMTIAPLGSQRRMLRLRYRPGEGKPEEYERPLESPGHWDEMTEVNRGIAWKGSSTFFPTFRRIEGGFSTTAPDPRARPAVGERDSGELQRATERLSDRLSVGPHRFVSSVATDDIIGLFKERHAESIERINHLYQTMTHLMRNMVGAASVAVGGPDESAEEEEGEENARETLREIRSVMGQVDSQREVLLRPFNVLAGLITKIFQYRGIDLGGSMTFGEMAEAIRSQDLSAGEKQMLSFLCYNAFASNSCVFIDEPEISLHVDWQRMLFPLLMKQSTGNQFIVATHSPFIYSRYADKELMLSSDRGDGDADAEDDGGRDHQRARKGEPADSLGGREG